MYFACFFISNCNFCVFNHTLARLAASEREASVLVYEELEKLLLLVVELYDVQALVEAYDPEILLREIAYVAFAAGYLLYAVFELLARYVVYFARLLYMRKLFVLVHIVYLRSF